MYNKCIFYKYNVSNTNGCREGWETLENYSSNILPNKTIGGWWVSDMPAGQVARP